MRNFYIVVPALSLINMGVNGATITNILTSRSDGAAETTGPYKLRGMNIHQDRQIHAADFSSTDAGPKDTSSEAVSPRQLPGGLALPSLPSLPSGVPAKMSTNLGLRELQPVMRFMRRQDADEAATDSSDEVDAAETDSVDLSKRQLSLDLSTPPSSFAQGANTEATTEATTAEGGVTSAMSNAEGLASTERTSASNEANSFSTLAISNAEGLASTERTSALNEANSFFGTAMSNAEGSASMVSAAASDGFSSASKFIAGQAATEEADLTSSVSSLALREDSEGSDCNEARDLTRGFTSDGRPIMIARDVAVPSLPSLPSLPTGAISSVPVVGSALGQRGADIVGTFNGASVIDSTTPTLPIRGLKISSLYDGTPMADLTTRALTVAFNKTQPSVTVSKRQDSSDVDVTDAEAAATGVEDAAVDGVDADVEGEDAAVDDVEAVEDAVVEDTVDTMTRRQGSSGVADGDAAEAAVQDDVVEEAVDTVSTRQDSSDVDTAETAIEDVAVEDVINAVAKRRATSVDAAETAVKNTVDGAVIQVAKRQDTSVDAAETAVEDDAVENTVDATITRRQNTSSDTTAAETVVEEATVETVDTTVTRRQDTSSDVDAAETTVEDTVVEDTVDTTVARRQDSSETADADDEPVFEEDVTETLARRQNTVDVTVDEPSELEEEVTDAEGVVSARRSMFAIRALDVVLSPLALKPFPRMIKRIRRQDTTDDSTVSDAVTTDATIDELD